MRAACRTIYAFGVAATVAALLVSFVLPATAQKYPDRPVKIVLPFGPGGVADVTARLVAEKLGDKLGQRFVIENMPGAGGISAANAVINAPPDGHTIGLVTNGTAISVALFKNLPFDPVRDYAMVSTIGTFDLVFAVNAESPFKTLGDFIAATKRDPGKLNIGTINVGGTQNLGAELLRLTAKLDVQIVPYRNSPDIVVALLRNDMQMLVEFPARGERPGRRRQAAPARHLRPEALSLDAGRADRRRGRRFRLRGHVMERRVRPQGDAAGRDRHPQQGAHTRFSRYPTSRPGSSISASWRNRARRTS